MLTERISQLTESGLHRLQSSAEFAVVSARYYALLGAAAQRREASDLIAHDKNEMGHELMDKITGSLPDVVLPYTLEPETVRNVHQRINEATKTNPYGILHEPEAPADQLYIGGNLYADFYFPLFPIPQLPYDPSKLTEAQLKAAKHMQFELMRKSCAKISLSIEPGKVRNGQQFALLKNRFIPGLRGEGIAAGINTSLFSHVLDVLREYTG